MPQTFRRLPALTALGGVLAALVTALPGAPAGAVTPAVVAPAPSVSGPAAVWTPTDQPLRATYDGLARSARPSDYAGFRLDLDALSTMLDRAPLDSARGATPTVVSIPAPTGELVRFAVEESPVMEEGLAELHPDIKTYSGRSLDGPASSIRLDTTPLGFHASVRGVGPAWYVDPGYVGNDQGPDALYVSYFAVALPEEGGVQEKGYAEMAAEAERAAAKGAASARRDASASPQRIQEGAGNTVLSRTYRVALATDPTFATYYTGNATTPEQVNSNVTAAKATIMNRVNQLYGDDMSLRMLLVAETDKTNFNTQAAAYDAGGRCGAIACYTATDVANGCSATLLNRNREVLGVVVGAEDYDIGHIGLGLNGGGIAGLGVVGLAGKARGCTGLTTPTGDFYAVDYVAHEMGHQFGGNHTFDGTLVNCAASNRSAANSVEPGSGSSIMAYAGICSADNLQPHSDPYFSQRSQTEIGNHITSTKPVANETSTVQLVGFDATDSFTLTFPGLGTTSAIVNGTSYTAAGIKAAVEAVTGGTATVSGYMAGATFDASGFQITFSGTRAGQALPNPVVTVVSGAFTGQGNDVVQGGKTTNGGISQEPSTNHVPVVTAPADKTIPTRTPFELTGDATDADADKLLYLWEQNDRGDVNGTPLVTVARPFGALFRVFGTYASVSAAETIKYGSMGENLATGNPSRTFPDIEQVIAGSTNAQNGTCPTPTLPTPTVPPSTSTNQSLQPGPFLDCVSELLPTAAYTGYDNDNALNFRFTARDLGGQDGGYDGGTTFDDVKLTVEPTAGPFLVTSQSAATTVAGRGAGTITWDVAGTNTAAMATNVTITLSTDGGRTYPITLLSTTPNDGSQAITWPNVATTKARVRVSAVDNYFFDLNNADITINAVPELTLGGNTPGTFTVQHSDAPAPTPVVTASSATADGSAITATATDLPAGLSLTKVSSSAAGVRPGTARFEVTGTATGDAGSFPVTVSVSDGAAPAQSAAFTVDVTEELASVTYTGPSQVTTSQGGTDAATLALSADVTEQADGSLGGLTATTATFTDTVTGETLCTAPVTGGQAACEAGADLTGTDDRTYEIAVTLGGNRYTGATTEDSPLVVRYDPGLVVSGPSATSAAQYSDALDPALTLKVSDRFVEASAITATASGLPAGLTLVRTDASGAGVLPGTATYAVRGTVDDVPGEYPVTVTVTDGQHADVVKRVTVTVSREDATATYTGPTRVVTRERGTGVATVPLTAVVTPADDGTAGDRTLATASFVDGATTLCTSPVAADGTASCEARLDAPATGDGSYDVAVVVGGRYVGRTSAPTTVQVLVDEGLALSAPASDSPSAQYSDAVSPTTALTASARFVAADDFLVSASGLPAGLSLTPSDATADGVTPGRTTYTVTGRTTAAPGSYPVTFTLGDGSDADHPDVTRSFTVTVTREDAAVAYTGPSTVAAAASDTSKAFTMTARVTDSGVAPGTAGDTSVGDVTTATVTFRDAATDAVLCADAPVLATSTAGVGTASCEVTATLPADDGRTYRVALRVGGRYAGASAADSPVVVEQADAPAGDTTPPQTTITSGPANGQVVLTRDVTFGYRSSEPGSTFTCSLSGVTGRCAATSSSADTTQGSATGRGLRTGSYDFRIAAADAAGNTDASPAARRFYIPSDDRVLTATRGPWQRRSSADTYRRTYTTVAQKGSELRFTMSPSRSLYLVVSRGRSYGSLDVYLGSRRLRTIDLRSTGERTQVLVPVARFGSATRGTVRLVTRTDAPVRIEGLAATAVAATRPQARMTTLRVTD